MGQNSSCDLLPDLVPSFTSISNVYVADVPGVSVPVLRYPFTFGNIGMGPFELRIGDKFYCDGVEVNPDEDMTATYGPNGSGSPTGILHCNDGRDATVGLYQRIYGKVGGAGTFRDEPTSSIYYDNAEDHTHYHTIDLGTATLRRVGADSDVTNWPIIFETAKQHFNMQDNLSCTNIVNCCNDGDNCTNIPNYNSDGANFNFNLGGRGYFNAGDVDGFYRAPASNNDSGLFYPGPDSNGDGNPDPASPPDKFNISGNSGRFYSGMSAGNADTYAANFDHQWIRLANNYCNAEYELVLEVNHESQFTEDRTDNNVAHGPIAITDGIDTDEGMDGRFVSSNETMDSNFPGVMPGQNHQVGEDVLKCKGDIIVNSGATLTIKDITISFSNSGYRNKILVRKGGKLILDNAKLTVCCSQLLWEGIQVEGTTNFAHVEANGDPITAASSQPMELGMVVMRNYSTIEHAVTGIKTETENQGSNGFNGIVIVENSIFKNNLCGVVLTGDNQATQTASKVKNTQFILNDDFHTHNFYNPGVEPIVQARIEHFNNFKFEGVQFWNSTLLTDLNVGNAIESAESTFVYVDGDMESENRLESEIYGFDTGISASHSNIVNQATQTLVEGVEFYKAINAITFTGYNHNITDDDDVPNRDDIGLHITNNIINLSTDSDGIEEGKWGICVEGCSDYVINKNTIKGGFKIPEGSNWFSAILAKYSPDIGPANYIQNNTIGDGNDNGSKVSVGINGYVDNPSLQVLCNTFLPNSMNIAIGLRAPSGSLAPVATVQGGCDEMFNPNMPETGPAGNNFANDHTNINLSGGNYTITYKHATNNEPNEDKVFGSITLEECDDNIEAQCSAFANGLKLVSDDGGGTNPPPPPPTPPTVCCEIQSDWFRTNIKQTEIEIQDAMSLLTDYTREDHSGLIQTARNMNQVKDIISNFKNYLSDNELTAVIKKLNVESASDVLSVLELNAPLNNHVLQNLTDYINSLSYNEHLLLAEKYEIEIKELYNNNTGSSAIQIKVLEINELDLEQKANIPGVNYCCRTKPETIMDVLQYAADNSTLNKSFFQKKLVDYAIEQKNTKVATLALSTINTANSKDLSDYVALQQFYMNMQKFDKTLNDLNKKDIAVLKGIANNNTVAGISARNAILALTDSLAVIQVSLPTLAKAQKVTKPHNPLLRIQSLKEKPIIYPNPAKNLLYLNMVNEAELPEYLNIKVFNSSGILVHKLNQKAELLNKIDINHVAQGTYFVEVLNQNYQLINRTKLLIIK